jgi:uncharacterized protein YndB with AHSA1/START domain
MTTAIKTQASIKIKASPEKVWEALTTPEIIKRWFFGVDTEAEWRVGGPIVHRGEWKGKPYEDKGRILKLEPGQVLEHNHWSSMSGLPDTPDNYQDVTWTLSSKGSTTELTVSEDNLPSEEAKSQSDKGWEMTLGNLKRLLETWFEKPAMAAKAGPAS